MRGYLGIDIGTTNTKALLLGEGGEKLWESAARTPVKRAWNMDVFDLGALEKIVDGMTEAAGEKCKLRGVAFSSVGESVVPVRGGRALADPILWYEYGATQDAREGEILKRLAPTEATGLPYDGYFSAGKMLWMRRNLPLGEAEAYLPLTGYFPYRRTGRAVWDWSQACRTLLFNVHERDWIDPLLAALSLNAPGALAPMGSLAGEAGGVCYGLGGHDHLTGLYGIYALLGGGPFFYDSMGTASLTALLLRSDREALKKNGAYAGASGCVAAGPEKSDYIVTRAFRCFGELLSRILRQAGLVPGAAQFDALNAKLEAAPPKGPGALFACDGDWMLGQRMSGSVNLFRAQRADSVEELLRDAYLYLAAGSAFEYEDLLRVAGGGGELAYYAGGGITGNGLFMRLKATALGREIRLLETGEAGALGAAVIAARVAGAREVEAGARKLLDTGRAARPDEALRPAADAALAAYRALWDRLRALPADALGLF